MAEKQGDELAQIDRGPAADADDYIDSFASDRGRTSKDAFNRHLERRLESTSIQAGLSAAGRLHRGRRIGRRRAGEYHIDSGDGRG